MLATMLHLIHLVVLINLTGCLAACPSATCSTITTLAYGATFTIPNNYPGNSIMCWRVTLAGAHGVLRFSSFSTEDGWDCVTVYDGFSETSPILLSASGSSNPGPVASLQTNYMLIKFVSDSSVSKSGAQGVVNSRPFCSTQSLNYPSQCCGGYTDLIQECVLDKTKSYLLTASVSCTTIGLSTTYSTIRGSIATNHGPSYSITNGLVTGTNVYRSEIYCQTLSCGCTGSQTIIEQASTSSPFMTASPSKFPNTAVSPVSPPVSFTAPVSSIPAASPPKPPAPIDPTPYIAIGVSALIGIPLLVLSFSSLFVRVRSGKISIPFISEYFDLNSQKVSPEDLMITGQKTITDSEIKSLSRQLRFAYELAGLKQMYWYISLEGIFKGFSMIIFGIIALATGLDVDEVKVLILSTVIVAYRVQRITVKMGLPITMVVWLYINALMLLAPLIVSMCLDLLLTLLCISPRYVQHPSTALANLIIGTLLEYLRIQKPAEWSWVEKSYLSLTYKRSQVSITCVEGLRFDNKQYYFRRLCVRIGRESEKRVSVNSHYTLMEDLYPGDMKNVPSSKVNLKYIGSSDGDPRKVILNISDIYSIMLFAEKPLFRFTSGYSFQIHESVTMRSLKECWDHLFSVGYLFGLQGNKKHIHAFFCRVCSEIMNREGISIDDKDIKWLAVIRQHPSFINLS